MLPTKEDQTGDGFKVLEVRGYQYRNVEEITELFLGAFAARRDVFVIDLGLSLEIVPRVLFPDDLERALSTGPAVRLWTERPTHDTHVGAVDIRGSSRLADVLWLRQVLDGYGIPALVEDVGAIARLRISIETVLPSRTVRSAIHAGITAAGLAGSQRVKVYPPARARSNGLGELTLPAPFMRDPRSGVRAQPIDDAGRPCAFWIEELVEDHRVAPARAVRSLARVGRRKDRHARDRK